MFALAAVIDVAINAATRPVSARILAARHKLPARHLEPVLQALVRDGILKGVRGPHGGYQLGRERRRISAEDVLRSAARTEDHPLAAGSNALLDIVRGAVADAERVFFAALSRINIDDMAQGMAKGMAKGAEPRK